MTSHDNLIKFGHSMSAFLKAFVVTLLNALHSVVNLKFFARYNLFCNDFILLKITEKQVPTLLGRLEPNLNISF